MSAIKTYITEGRCVTPLGFDTDTNWQQLLAGHSEIKNHTLIEGQPSFLASRMDDDALNEKFRDNFDHPSFTRLEKMLMLSLKPLIEKHTVSPDSVLILSTTKGNISHLKNCAFPPEASYLPVLAQRIADFFTFSTRPVIISNACVSGVMAVSLAKNLLESGMYRDAFVIAGDEVSEFVLSGFNSFQALSPEPCKPYDASRNGISIGEATAAVYVTTTVPENEIFFEICGESAVNDANHISGPSRTGEGLYLSITNALREAGIPAAAIDYLSAHGTATVYNDEMESIAFTRAGLQQVPVNSLKGFYGHTLGAAGLLELVLAMESAKRNTLIASKNYRESGVSHPLNILTEHLEKETNYILKTASGFGGCNAAVILKKHKP